MEYNVIGIMSGTSLDGVDLAFCNFRYEEGAWSYRINRAITVAYPDSWKERLSEAHLKSADDLSVLDREYGQYLGLLANSFSSDFSLQPDLIASHGHTVFHAPEKGLTLQVGSGSEIAKLTDLPVVFDFRKEDVAKGGQGAPLVPVGDKLLFGQYDACLNLGGFSNISFDQAGVRVAFDICPVNIVLNQLAALSQKEFDDQGALGRAGMVDCSLLEEMNNLPYYQQDPPKSLSREWLEREFLPLLTISDLSTEDKAATIYRHITEQLLKVFTENQIRQVLLTGGGALNTYLTDLLKERGEAEIVIPDPTLIDFKEALVFAFLGLLRFREEVNCYSSVTGASEDSIVGNLIKKAPAEPGLNPN